MISVNAFYTILFISDDFTKYPDVWRNELISITEFGGFASVDQLTIYGEINENLTKFTPKFTTLGRGDGDDFVCSGFVEQSKSDTLKKIADFFQFPDDFFNKKLIDTLEALIYSKKRITPPDLDSVGDGFDTILERGDEISIDQYNIPADKLKFIVNRMISIGKTANLDFSKFTEVDDILEQQFDFEWDDDIELVIAGCEEGVL